MDLSEAKWSIADDNAQDHVKPALGDGIASTANSGVVTLDEDTAALVLCDLSAGAAGCLDLNGNSLLLKNANNALLGSENIVGASGDVKFQHVGAYSQGDILLPATVDLYCYIGGGNTVTITGDITCNWLYCYSQTLNNMPTVAFQGNVHCSHCYAGAVGVATRYARVEMGNGRWTFTRSGDTIKRGNAGDSSCELDFGQAVITQTDPAGTIDCDGITCTNTSAMVVGGEIHNMPEGVTPAIRHQHPAAGGTDNFAGTVEEIFTPLGSVNMMGGIGQ